MSLASCCVEKQINDLSKKLFLTLLQLMLITSYISFFGQQYVWVAHLSIQYLYSHMYGFLRLPVVCAGIRVLQINDGSAPK